MAAQVSAPATRGPEGVALVLADYQQLLDAAERLRRCMAAHLGHALPAAMPASTEPAVPGVAVYCLGPFAVRVDGEPIEAWRNGKARALFQYLVNARHRSASRESLIGALWPDPEALATYSSLKVTVHALRQHLLRTPELGDSVNVVVLSAGYQVVSQNLWLDVDEFDRCYALGRRMEALGQAEEAIAAYARAADVYRGDFLEDSEEEWALLRRESLKDRYLLVLGRMAETAFASGDAGACIEWCQRILQYDACREDAFRALMLCHAALGQRGRAHNWYDLCVRTLKLQLAIEPEPETEQAFRIALTGSPSLGARDTATAVGWLNQRLTVA